MTLPSVKVTLDRVADDFFGKLSRVHEYYKPGNTFFPKYISQVLKHPACVQEMTNCGAPIARVNSQLYLYC